MSTAFLRALSPTVNSLAGVTAATISDPSEMDVAARAARQTAMQSANSLEELTAMVPSDFRDVLRPHILDTANLATKRLHAYDTWNRWNTHWNGGDPKTFPTHILSKAPSVQLSKEYAATDEGRSHTSTLEKAHLAFCKGLLRDSMTAKESEAKHLDGLLSPEALWGRIGGKLRERIASLKSSRREPVFSPVVSEGAEEGEIEITGWQLSAVTSRAALQIQQDAVAFCFRAIAIVEGRHIASRSKVERKKEIAAAADVEMADATKPGPSIQSMIDRAVSARLNKVPPKRSNNASKPANGGVSTHAQLNATLRALERPPPFVRKLTSFQKKQSDRAMARSRKADGRQEASREKRTAAAKTAHKRRFPPIPKPARKGRDGHKQTKH